MTGYRKGDVCSLEVVVSHQPAPDEVIVVVPLSAAADQSRCVPAEKLTLLRRAPVDLATCDLSEPVAVTSKDGTPGKMHARIDNGHGVLAAVEWNGDHAPEWVRLESLCSSAPMPSPVALPRMRAAVRSTVSCGPEGRYEMVFRFPNLDAMHAADDEWRAAISAHVAPAPESEVERLRAALEGMLHAVCGVTGFAACVRRDAGVAWPWPALDLAEAKARKALVSSAPADASYGYQSVPHGSLSITDAPTCPAGHIMIGDRAVPEPMRIAPTSALYKLYVVSPVAPGGYIVTYWGGETWQREALKNGLIHSTEANARAHAEAIIAMSMRGDA